MENVKPGVVRIVGDTQYEAFEADNCAGCAAASNDPLGSPSLCRALGDCGGVSFREVGPATAAPQAAASEHAARKATPVFSGLLRYFPLAVQEVARLSVTGMKQHNLPELGWDRTKSSDHGDCIVRHQIDFDKLDSDGHYHAVKVAWRALAQLELLLEKERV